MTDEQSPSRPTLTPDDIAAAERLVGMAFTDAERELMLGEAQKRLSQYDELRAVPLDNGAQPAFTFDPRPVRDRFVTKDIPRTYNPQPVQVERPATLEDAAFYSVVQLAELVRTRQVTSVELTEMYLRRLERYNAQLECVVTFTRERALAQAQRADDEIAAGKYRGPLHGIPWGAKDLLAVRGYRTTWGAAPYKDQTLDADATVVERLDAAGAVLIAKLSLGELASGDRWFGGKTRNPWDIREPSGGSSAGSAAATSAGLVGFAIGSETAGSIVWPSGRCGVSGYRPTYGFVPRTGAMSLSWTMDKIGPIARTAEDCALIMTAIYGPDGQDASAIDAPFAYPADVDLRTLRVGYVPEAFDAPDYESSEYADTLKTLRKHGIELRDDVANNRESLQALKALGVELVPVTLPDFPIDAMRLILTLEGAAAFEPLTRDNLDDQLVWQAEDSYANRFRQAHLIPAVAYLHANRIRALLVEAMADTMQDVDTLIMPQIYANNLTATNLTGQPSVALPNGLDPRGMPTAIYLIGKPFDDARLLTLAAALQRTTGHHVQHPPLDWA